MRGYRKFIVVMCALVSAFVLALVGKLSGEYATIAAACVGAYQLAHAVADYAYGRPLQGPSGDS